MSDVEPATTELKTQYGAQVAADLERIAKERERVSAEVAALQEQLRALEYDHALLANLQQTLGSESGAEAGPGAGERVSTTPSVPRQTSARAEPARRKKAVAAAGAKKPSAGVKQSTLVELIRDHLVQQSEPRSSAEITAALTQAHPEREIKPKVVRTTVEGLVAKGHVHRTKQGSSVFYTAGPKEPVGDSAQEKASAAG
jgi:hypothetical protein